MLTTLAIFPTIVLLFYIYKKDKREKEPLRLLLKGFVFGILICLPVIILESLIAIFVEESYISGSYAYAFLDAFIVAAFSEELFKYIALKSVTWKSYHFNCTFDGIVYAVFVSLGFATLENILYVFDGGISVAIMRMLTSVPGHACYAVYMGYFYSRAKKASLVGDMKALNKNKRLALIVPILFHGIYDFLLSLDEEVVGVFASDAAILIWFLFVIVLFVITFIVINIASKHDALLHPYAELGDSFLLKKNVWICECNSLNNYAFCPSCGRAKT